MSTTSEQAIFCITDGAGDCLRVVADYETEVLNVSVNDGTFVVLDPVQIYLLTEFIDRVTVTTFVERDADE